LNQSEAARLKWILHPTSFFPPPAHDSSGVFRNNIHLGHEKWQIEGFSFYVTSSSSQLWASDFPFCFCFFFFFFFFVFLFCGILTSFPLVARKLQRFSRSHFHVSFQFFFFPKCYVTLTDTLMASFPSSYPLPPRTLTFLCT